MVLHTLPRSTGVRLQHHLNRQRRHRCESPSPTLPPGTAATTRRGQFCDVLIQLRPASANSACRFAAAANFCVLAAQSTFIGDQFFVDGGVPFSIQTPLTIELAGDGHQCEECLLKAMDFVYDEPVQLELGSEHVEHLRGMASMLGLAELWTALESVVQKNQEQQLEAALSAPVIDEIVLHFDEVPDKPLSRAGAFQYKVQSQSTAPCKKHICPGCPFKCYKPSEMLFHLSTCTSTNTTCNLCDQQFADATQFRDHLPRHSHAKPFYCNTCDQRFTTKTALGLHTPKHSPIAPFHCNVCGKRFKWKSGLRSHQQVTHATHAQLLCDECGFSTAHLKTLRAHQLGHTGAAYRCSVPLCTYTSRRKENLRTHLATHRNETPFVCEVCGHCFSQNKNLKRHALVHVARDLHRCPHCDFSNYRTDKLKEHMARQHTERPLQLVLSEMDVQSELLLDGDGIIGSRPEEATMTEKVPLKLVRRSKASAAATARRNGAIRRGGAVGGEKRGEFVAIAPKPEVFGM